MSTAKSAWMSIVLVVLVHAMAVGVAAVLSDDTVSVFPFVFFGLAFAQVGLLAWFLALANFQVSLRAAILIGGVVSLGYLASLAFGAHYLIWLQMFGIPAFLVWSGALTLKWVGHEIANVTLARRNSKQWSLSELLLFWLVVGVTVAIAKLTYRQDDRHALPLIDVLFGLTSLIPIWATLDKRALWIRLPVAAFLQLGAGFAIGLFFQSGLDEGILFWVGVNALQAVVIATTLVVVGARSKKSNHCFTL